MLRLVSRVLLFGCIGAASGARWDCDPDREPCNVCDPVALLLGSPEVQGGAWTIPADAAAYCDGHELPAHWRWSWQQKTCGTSFAQYVVRAIDWTDDPEGQWMTHAAEDVVCGASKVSAGGCDGGPSEPKQSIVGPAEIDRVTKPEAAIALVVPTAEIELADDDVLTAGFDLDAPTAWVLGNPHKDDGGYAYPACTAFLIAPRHLLTARHCIRLDATECAGEANLPLDGHSLLFDYTDHPASATRVEGGQGRIRVVECGIDPAPYGSFFSQDWALIELDEPMVDRTPLQLPESDELQNCTPIYAFGHPLGHPLHRIGTRSANEPDAWVLGGGDTNGTREATFVSTLDIVEGFSGAPIFTMHGHLVGMQVNGVFIDNDSDAVRLDSPLWCNPTSVCGEAIRLSAVAEAIAAHLDD